TVTHDAISLAYAEFTDHRLHGSGKDHITTQAAAAHSAESGAAAQHAVALNSHTINCEARSDSYWKTRASVRSSASSSIASIDVTRGNTAHVYSAVPEHSATINSPDATLAHGEFSFRGEPAGHANDQPHFENASPGTLQSLESPTQAALHAHEGGPD